MNEKKRVVITGIGAIAGNAGNIKEFEQACIKGESGIRKCTAFDTEGLLTEYFGQAQNLPVKGRLNELIRISAQEMLSDSGLTPEVISQAGTECGIFYGTLLSNTDSYFRHSLDKQSDKPCNDTLACMNEYASYVKKLLGVKGTMHISSAACASGTTAAGMAFDYIRSGICNMAVVGGADPQTKIAAYGFNALKSLSSGVCNPYDENRNGINIGECGAFVMMESLDHALERKAKIYCEIAGYGLGNDAYHVTSPDPEGKGAYQAMQMALLDAGIVPNDIDYINGHGTGTPINDSMEIKAINMLLKNSSEKTAVSSTKALIGHCMGASGVIELISVILSMRSNKYLPMPNLRTPISGSEEVFLSGTTADINIKYALSNSFAFAGNSASVLIKSYDKEDCK